MQDQGRSADIDTLSREQFLPSWLANLFFFGLLITLVLVAFFWQMHRVDRGMQHNAMERSRLVAGVIEENLRNADLAAQAIEKITSTFLDDKARFIEYLDSIEPLQKSELTALARETGLVGITLVRASGETVVGPDRWMSNTPECTSSLSPIRYNRQQGIGYLIRPVKNKDNDLACIVVGLDASEIISLQKRTGLPVLLATLSSLPGINYIRLETVPPATGKPPASVRLIRTDTGYTAETCLQSSKGTLIVGLNAENFIRRRTSLRNQFFLFGSLLLGVGFFFSWLLYRYQKKDLERTRNFERMIAREHEAAALGRATATIAHEVRNPLNAINMGLQRLSMESDNLDREQKELINAMRQAVDRTSTIVTELQRFTRDLRPECKPFPISTMIRQQITLYNSICRQQGIELSGRLLYDGKINGDSELLAELVENLFKNAVEAQPEGGHIQLTLARERMVLVLTVSNHGFTLSAEESSRLGEPYFTTKIRGTGLGLALCRRIAEAHGGNLSIEPDPVSQTLTIRVELPVLCRNEDTP